jgi:hypothetical protein
MTHERSKAYGHGKLTDDDKRRIAEMHDRGRKCGPIARALRRHQATVSWYMYQQGMRIAPPCPEVARSWMRGSKVCWTYDRKEEQRAIALRKEGKTFMEIADILNAEFNRDRNWHSVHVRLVMSSSREGLDENE